MYQKVALAIAFSPRMEALIAEARRLKGLFQGELVLIHVGVKTPELEAKLDEILKRLCADLGKVKVIWKEGKPAKTILKTCEEEGVDLLVLGALKKEGLLTYYLGSVARKVIRKSPCSVLTLIDPKIETTRSKRVSPLICKWVSFKRDVIKFFDWISCTKMPVNNCNMAR